MCIRDRYYFVRRSGNVFPYKVGADRKLPVPAVDQNREFNAIRPAHIHDRVHRGARRPTRIKHVVHQDNLFIRYIEINVRRSHDGLLRIFGKVVPVKCDVQRSQRNIHPFKFLDIRSDTFGDGNADVYKRQLQHPLRS